jgi:hypothetical protein
VCALDLKLLSNKLLLLLLCSLYPLPAILTKCKGFSRNRPHQHFQL